MRTKLTILQLLFSIGFSNAQLPDYHVQLFNEKNGLHTFLMQDLVNDQNGFIWMVHRLKVQRFDGRQVKDFPFNETMFSIFCDDENNIWAASRSNIYKYSEKQKEFRKIVHDTTGNPSLGRFLKIPGYGFSIHSNKCFYFFDKISNTFKEIKSGALASIRTMAILSVESYGKKVFVQSGSILYRIDVLTDEISRLDGASDVNVFQALNEDLVMVSSFNNYSYWFNFKTKSITKIDIGKGLGKASSYFLRISDVHQLNVEEYLMSSIRGLLLYNIKTGRFRKLQLFCEGKPLLSEDLINRIVVDEQKNVWIIYNYNGLIYFRASKGQVGLIRNAEIEEDRSWHNSVRNFAEDENGDLWMATLNGFAHFDLRTGHITPYHPSVNDTNTYSFPSMRGIACSNEVVILGPTNRGLWLYNRKTKSYRRPEFLPNDFGRITRNKLTGDFIDHITKLKSGDYIISARDGHYFMNGKTFLVTMIHYPGENENGNFSYQERSGNIWLGNQRKLYCFDPNMNFLFRADLDEAQNISTMLEIGLHTYLVAGRGVYLLQKRADHSFSVTLLDSYFKNLIVNVLFQDKNNKIWIGTSDGLTQYDLTTRRTELYNYFDNVEGNIFYARSCLLTKSGILFLGGVSGVNYMIPEEVISRKDTLKTFVTRLAVNNEDIAFQDQILSLRHSQNTIDVEFTAPYFSRANNVRYRYWLEGLDEQWISNGTNNTVRFSSLAPGNYHFKVAASINDENWFESGRSFSFVILPPFWKTWWFMSLAFIFIVAAIYSIYRYQLNKRIEVERLRYRISRDLHDDIGSTLSSINILARSSLAKKSEGENQTILLEKIQQRSQKTLDAMDDLIWNTKPENDSLESLIVRMREFASEVLEPAGISFTLNCPASLSHVKLDMQQKRNLYLIFKEAVNNIAKYSSSKNASINFEYQRKLLQMIIGDEGTGFTLASIKKGNGLDNMQTRATEMNAQFEIRSGNGQGTVVRVHVPV